MELADGPYRASADHRPSLAHHRIGAVGMRKAELHSGRPNFAGKTYRRAEVVRQRFVTDYMESGVQRCRADIIVTVIRCHYSDDIDAVFPVGLAFNQFKPGRISALFGH